MVEITRKRGDTYADELTIISAKTKQPIDITGYTFTMTLDPERAPADATNNLYSLAGVIVDAVAGRVEFAPTALQSDQPPKGYYYDVQMIDGVGRKRTIALDKYKYIQDISKG